MYIFRFPKAADFKFTYEALNNYIERGKGWGERKVGTTVNVERTFGPSIRVVLYDTVIARVYSDGSVEIPETINEYGSQATTKWVEKILQDNGVGRFVYREGGKYVGVAGETFRPAELASV